MSLILCLLNQLTVSFVWGTRVAIKTALSAMKVDIPHWLVVALRRRAMISAVRFHIPCRIRAYGIYYEWIWNMNIYIWIMFSLWNIMLLFHYEWICMIPKLISKTKQQLVLCIYFPKSSAIWQPVVSNLTAESPKPGLFDKGGPSCRQSCSCIVADCWKLIHNWSTTMQLSFLTRFWHFPT
jgi:hypothetical protein